jgi:hypothetical protein
MRTVAAAAAALFTLVACDAGRHDPQPAASAGGDHKALVDAAVCMRGHGFPDYPDPVETGGRWALPPAAENMAPKPAPECTDEFRRAGLVPAESHRPVGPDEMAKLRKWATCMRTNGLPDWPDPDGDGIFHPQPMPADDDPRRLGADTACRSLEPGPITVDAGTTANKHGD